MQIAMRWYLHSHHRSKKSGVGIKELRRKAATRERPAGAVKILKNETQQLGALNDSLFYEAPLVCRNQKWNDIDLPRPIYTEGIAVNVVRDAGFPNASSG